MRVTVCGGCVCCMCVLLYVLVCITVWVVMCMCVTVCGGCVCVHASARVYARGCRIHRHSGLPTSSSAAVAPLSGGHPHFLLVSGPRVGVD